STWRPRPTVKLNARRRKVNGSATGMPTHRRWSPPQRASAEAERRGHKRRLIMKRSRGARLFLLAAALSGCTLDTATDALNSLGASRFSMKHHSGFWAAEAQRKTALWEKAQSYCRASESAYASYLMSLY